jgi:hypothetical protein
MFSLYNSPYAAHGEGRAVDLYPELGAAPSPVAGEVLETRSVDAPPKPYAEREDYLILLDVDPGDPVVATDGRDLVARVLHVDPGIRAGDRVDRGDRLGRTVRSGFFAPWVGDHLHVGLRAADANLHRASGSLPLVPGVDVEGLAWDGRGTVVAAGPTYVLLDRPVHPAPGERFAGVAADGAGSALDGGLPHYDGGGLLGTDPGDGTGTGSGVPVSLLGAAVGTRSGSGRTVAWDGPTVLLDGDPVTGLSLYAGRDRAGAKVICPGHDYATGDAVRVDVRTG